ncbi:MAG: ferritin family protein [Desulfobacteraceae bacterium]|nr:ferritin family protein [Desulfobacteraceae bacterium]
MAYNFSADEIFEMAKQIERNGAEFYKKAAESVQGEDEKSFLLSLAQMEENHEKTFADMQKDLADKEKASQVFDPVEEAILYLKALADTRIFFEKPFPGGDMKEILKTALDAEKDSIVFYLGMKELVPGELGKKRVDNIVKEEMEHIRILSGKLLEQK